MANPDHLQILRLGSEEWHQWRRENPNTIPDLSNINLREEMLKGYSPMYAVSTIQVALGAWNFTDFNFSRTNFQGSNLTEIHLQEADLTGANLKKSILKHVNLAGAQLTNANLAKAKLQYALLRDALLIRSNLTGTNLKSANLTRADLTGAVLHEANLTKVVLIQANLEEADLTKANLTRIVIDDGKGNSANLSHATMRKVKITAINDSTSGRSFLDLAAADGIDTVDFGEKTFLREYLARAFKYAHQPGLSEQKKYPFFVNKALENIKLLRSIIENGDIPDELISVQQLLIDELIKYLKSYPRELHNIRPRQFEEIIAEILASFGWEVQLSPETQDGSYDIFAISKDISGVKHNWIIECKKLKPERRIGVDIVRSLYGVGIDLKVGNMMLATTSDFTKRVKDFKTSRYNLDLRNYESILDWVNTYKPNPNGKLYIKDNKLVMPTVSRYSCFISYSTANEDFAKKLHTDLTDKGTNCWFAPQDLKTGENIGHVIDSQIKEREKLLLILSEQSIDSTWVGREVKRALAREKELGTNVLFPVMIDDAVMFEESGWGKSISRRLILDFTNWKDQNSYTNSFKRLLRDLKVE